MKKYNYFPINKINLERYDKMYHWNNFENRRRGSYSFPIEYHHVTKEHPRYIMAFHWHPECELIRVLEGSFEITVASQNYLLTKGSVLFIPNNAVHGGIPSDCVYECIVFDFIAILQNSVFSDTYYGFFSHKKDIKRYYDKNQLEISELMEKLFTVVKNRNEGWQINTVGCLFQFLGIISEKQYYSEVSKDNQNLGSLYVERFENVFNLIRAKYKEVITLEDMAQAAGMSSKYFCQMFKQLTHYTPIEYLVNYRIEYAKYLLCIKNMAVSDVAIHTGFNSTAYFIKVFKKFTDTTPKQYVKTNSKFELIDN